MHIITGFLLASLLKKGKDNKPPMTPLLRMCAPVRTCHLLPGRVRFEVKALKGNQAGAEKLTDTLMRIQGLDQVTVSPISASVVIHFDPEQISAELLVVAIIKVLGLEQELDKPPASVIGKEINQLSQALNRAVYDQTNGLIDLRTALLISMAGLGIVKLWSQPHWALPAGFTLLWWSGSGLFRPVEAS